jgi:hypothetical protein
MQRQKYLKLLWTKTRQFFSKLRLLLLFFVVSTCAQTPLFAFDFTEYIRVEIPLIEEPLPAATTQYDGRRFYLYSPEAAFDIQRLYLMYETVDEERDTWAQHYKLLYEAMESDCIQSSTSYFAFGAILGGITVLLGAFVGGLMF